MATASPVDRTAGTAGCRTRPRSPRAAGRRGRVTGRPPGRSSTGRGVPERGVEPRSGDGPPRPSPSPLRRRTRPRACGAARRQVRPAPRPTSGAPGPRHGPAPRPDGGRERSFRDQGAAHPSTGSDLPAHGGDDLPAQQAPMRLGTPVEQGDDERAGAVGQPVGDGQRGEGRAGQLHRHGQQACSRGALDADAYVQHPSRRVPDRQTVPDSSSTPSGSASPRTGRRAGRRDCAPPSPRRRPAPPARRRPCGGRPSSAGARARARGRRRGMLEARPAPAPRGGHRSRGRRTRAAASSPVRG
jgi:hypothetical protein